MMAPSSPPLSPEVAAIQAISAVPTILEAVAAITGLRFVCVAHVTADAWTACAVLDKLNFGLVPGQGLDVTTTLCEQVRDTASPVIIDEVRSDATYRDHHTPRIYGFQSYISIPIHRPDGSYFGTLCGLDPQPAQLSNPATVTSMTLFAELIALQLASETSLAAARAALLDAEATAELREQFIGVLGHDVRNPLAAILSGTDLLLLMPDLSPHAATVVRRMQRSGQRISGLVDDVVDFTRGKLGGGIVADLRRHDGIVAVLEQVVAELRTTHPGRALHADLEVNDALRCDAGRLGQLLSNLVKNALVHGDPAQPVVVTARTAGPLFRLSVKNGGAAIAAEVLAQLFKPFWRGQATAANEGLGLGLFIVAEIARAHGGRIAVRSDAQVTEFSFTMALDGFIERRGAGAAAANPGPERRSIVG